MLNCSSEELNRLKTLKNRVETATINGDLPTAKKLMSEYKNQYPFDADIYSIEVSICMKEGNEKKAMALTKEGLARTPFKFDLTYNLAVLLFCRGDATKAAQTYATLATYCNNDEERNQLKELSSFLLTAVKEDKDYKHLVELIKDVKKQRDPRYFPLKKVDETYIGQKLFPQGNECYYTNYYRMALPNYHATMWPHIRTEILKGRFVANGKKPQKIKIDQKCVVPISVKRSGQSVKTCINSSSYEIQNMTANHFYYLPVNETGTMTIESPEEYFIGNKLFFTNPGKKTNKKLVLNIFMDGLAEEMIKGDAFKHYMPNTAAFFGDGLRFTNAFANGEWTLPSTASIFTGGYTVDHQLFHPNFTFDIGRKQPLLSNIFQDNGYLTFQICGDWRKSPSYGYARGFDRTIYQQCGEGSKCGDVIFETIDQLRAFKDRSQFGWISLFELHDVYENRIPTIVSQLKNSLNSLTICANNDKSVRGSYNEKMVERYISEMGHLDYYLQILYRFIEENYDKKDVVVTLVSDHGQSYIADEPLPIKSTRQNVPIMITGGGIPQGVSDELVENLDLPRILTHASGIETSDLSASSNLPKIMGGKKEREYAYSESIFPGKTYKAAINDATHHFVFETEGRVENDGRFHVHPYKTLLINKHDGKNEQTQYKEKVKKYEAVVFDHIKRNIII